MKKNSLIFLLVVLLFLSLGGVVIAQGKKGKSAQPSENQGVSTDTKPLDKMSLANPKLPPRPPAPNGIKVAGKQMERATFAGGCFWCMETPFEELPGVYSVTSGYTGGTYKAPSYTAVSHHKTDQVEAIDIIFDPKKVTFSQLLDIYWRQIDPTDDGGQFVDRGSQYRPIIWVHNKSQRDAAVASKKQLIASQRFDKPITVPIVDAVTFWPAEEYHQDFYKKNPEHYHSYRSRSGRDQCQARYWGEKK